MVKIFWVYRFKRENSFKHKVHTPALAGGAGAGHEGKTLVKSVDYLTLFKSGR
jgi:hypothetical protein